MASASSDVQVLHNSLLVKLSDMMDPSNSTYKNFIRCLVCDTLPIGKLSNVQRDPIDVFNLMEERGVLGVGKYEHLEKALENSRYIVILDLLKKEKECITEQMRKSRYSDDPKMDKSYNIEPATVSSIKPEDINKLRGDLIKVYKPLRSVQVSPIYEMTRWPEMDNVYVDLVLETKQDSNVKVTNYKQIFLDERGSRLKRVYLRGKGGLGKTTFCRRVVHAWCNAHEGKAVAQDGPFQDEAILQMFDILFYMNLREVSVDKDLIDAICDKRHFLLPLKSVLENLLRLNGDKILFIFDGLDEMIVKAGFIENIVIHMDYPDCCFLVSSRPWKISQMELQVGSEIDLLLDLQGFSKKNAIKFAENIFGNCYNDGNVIQQFEEDINRNKLAKQLIHVPLLLVFLTHCWYEKRSLPTKLHELYISFLNMMADRLTEKYKKDANHSQMNFGLGDTHSAFPRKLSETSLVVKFGERFLLSLCGAAHHFLLSNEKENSLVFEETALLNVLGDRGEEILDVSLKLGLLSVTDSVSYLNRKLSVSFIHKTMQEFFTAVCFILSPDKLVHFISSITHLNDVQQNENIIVFLVGLMPELGKSVLEKVNELCKDDWEALKKKNLMILKRANIKYYNSMYGKFVFENPAYDRLYNISQLYLRCNDDMMGENVLLNVAGLVLIQKVFDPHPWNLAFLQSLILNGTEFKHSTDYSLVDLRGLTGLGYLGLKNLTCELYLPESGSLSILITMSLTLSSCSCDRLGRTLTQCTKLESLTIKNTDLHNCVLDLSSMTELTCLYLSKVTLSSSCCDVLWCTLIHCTKLESLTIKNTDLHNCVLDLSNMTELTCLCMSKVTLSSTCCDVLWSTLIHCTKLESLTIKNTDLHSCVLDLSNMTELTYLYLSQVRLSSSCCDVLGRTLAHCTKLKTLRICNTDLHNCLLDLSKMTELTDLYMSEVTLSCSCCDVLGSTLAHCTKLKTLRICYTDLHNCLLDVSKMTELKDLYLSKVRLSISCCDVLGSTLTHCTKLNEITLWKTDLHNCLLDLSKMTEPTYLYMSEVTLSSSCCDVLGSTLTHCTKLNEISLCNTDLHNCLLDLSKKRTELNFAYMSEPPCDILGSTLIHCTKLKTLRISTELTHLCMSKVTLFSSCCDVFGSTLAHCTKLKTLSICKADLHNCLLDLSKMTELTELFMSEVTLSTSCFDVLWRTLAHCTKLKALRIYNTELTHLGMSELTLSSSCCDVLGSTLSHCTKLSSLYLENTDLSNCMLDLNMTELYELTLKGVTLSSRACQVLEQSLAQLKASKYHFLHFTYEKLPSDNDKWKVSFI